MQKYKIIIVKVKDIMSMSCQIECDGYNNPSKSKFLSHTAILWGGGVFGIGITSTIFVHKYPSRDGE